MVAVGSIVLALKPVVIPVGVDCRPAGTASADRSPVREHLSGRKQPAGHENCDGGHEPGGRYVSVSAGNGRRGDITSHTLGRTVVRIAGRGRLVRWPQGPSRHQSSRQGAAGARTTPS